MKRYLHLLALGLLVLQSFLLYGGALAQESAEEPPPPPERLPPWEQEGRGPEARAWRPLKTVGRAGKAHPTSLPWHIERVDAPKTFSNMGPRSLVLDVSGHPHIAYGADRLYYAWHNGIIWRREVVDPSWGVGQYTSLALDASGRPHISYYDESNHTLKYAHFDGSSWITETVDSTGYVGSFTSLALDASGRPHISYCDSTNDNLKYAHFDGTSWISETVASVGYEGQYTSLALDASDHPHISYYRNNGDYTADLKYAYFDGSSWITQTVDSDGWVGQYSSLALDANNHPHISYFDWDNYDLKYAHFDGAAWITETVDSTGRVGPYTSLALDANDYPHISYLDQSNWDLKYAHFDGASWITETVDSAGWNLFTSLALDASDRSHISYYDESNHTLKYAHFDGSSWITETVDSGESVGRYTSLALDANGHPHISYYDSTNGDLKYAYYDGAAWISETVDSEGYVGYFTSLALDSAGRPHISYYDDTNRDLKYAHFDGSAWLSETVDSLGGWHTSLALDAAGRPHISYCHCFYDPFTWTCDDLKYAQFDGASWQIETVDSAGDVGTFTSLALDASGRPHISYQKRFYFESILKYAYHDGTTWIIETVASPGCLYCYTGYYTSLTLDAAGRPHTSYYDRTNDDLKYAHFDGASWITETVDSTGRVGAYTSLALDVNDHPYISYSDWTNDALKYAYYDGADWISETVDSAGQVGAYTSLALDANGHPHISYYDSTNGDLKYAWGECVPVAGVSITGPAALSVGRTDRYTVAYTPPTASISSIIWDNGTLGLTAAYSWTTPGSHTLAVTATNPCAEVSSTFTVTVFCQPLEGVDLTGPGALLVGQEGTYRAAAAPITASLPLTFTWDSGALGPTAIYSWPATGTYTLTVTATNLCGQAQGRRSVQVIAEWPYSISLPLILKHYTPPSCIPVTATAFTWMPITPTVGQVVTLTGSTSGTAPIFYSWRLEVGELEVGKTITHVYTITGEHLVTLTATNGCGSQVVTQGITVLPSASCLPVTATAFSWVPLTPTVGQVVTFTASASGTEPISFSWDLGDGFTATGPLVTHSYAVTGTYAVTLAAANLCGQDVASATLTVLPLSCTPVTMTVFTWEPFTPTADQVVTFTGSASGTEPISFTWDLGDGFTATGPLVTHSYAVSGTYSVTLTAANPCGVLELVRQVFVQAVPRALEDGQP